MTTIICKYDEDLNEEFFFSTDHSQPNLAIGWVPVSYHTKSKQEIRAMKIGYPINGRSCKEIPNPDPNYQA